MSSTKCSSLSILFTVFFCCQELGKIVGRRPYIRPVVKATLSFFPNSYIFPTRAACVIKNSSHLLVCNNVCETMLCQLNNNEKVGKGNKI